MGTTEQELQQPVAGGRVARNALLNLIGLGAPLAVSLVTLPLLIGALGPERFGILAIAWMILTYLGELGFGPTTMRYASAALGAGRPAELGAIAWTTGWLQAVIGCVEGLALAAITPWLVGDVLRIPAVLAGEARACLYLLALAIPLLGFGKSLRGLVEAAQRFDLALAVHLPITAGAYLLAAAAALLRFPLPVVFGIIVAARIATLPAYYFAARRALPGVSLRPAAYRGALRELGSFAGWVSVSTVVSPLLVYLDRFIVGMLLSMTAVTLYTAPYEIVARLALIPVGIVGALYPAFSQLTGGGRGEQAENLAGRSVTMVVSILAPILVVLLGSAHDGLTAWLGAEYAQHGALALQILAVGVLLNAAAHVPFALLQSIGRPDIPARFHLLELPIHVGATWILVSRFGIPGAAMAWTGRMLLDAALLFTAAARTGVLRGHVLMREGLPAMVAVVMTTGAAVLLVQARIDSVVPRVAAVVMLAVVTAALLWRGVMKGPERARLAALLRP